MDTITTAVQEITIDSNRIIHEARCDLINRNIPDIVKLVQYDQTLPIIAVGLYKAGIPYALPSEAACNIRVKKPDGYVVYNPALGCNTERTVVYFEATSQMTIAAGEMPAIIEIVAGARIAGTSPLRIRVEENPIQESDIESDSEVTTIVEAIVDLVGEAEEARDQAASSATAASGSATAAAGSEAWAVGTKNGIDVGSGDPQYHNNAKYYAEQMECFDLVATGDGTVTITLSLDIPTTE